MTCRQCGSALDEDVNICPSCGTPHEEQVEASIERIGIFTKLKKRPLLFALLTVAMVAVMAFFAYKFFSRDRLKNAIVYKKDGHFFADNLSVKIDLGEEEIKEVKISGSGKRLFYISGRNSTLKYLDLTMSDRPKVVDDHVFSYSISKNGKTVYYTKGGALSNTLYKWQSGRKEALFQDVDFMQTSSDGKRLAFFSKGTMHVYDRGKIVIEAQELIYYNDIKTVYYLSDSKVYIYKSGKKKAVVEDVKHIKHVYESGKMFFVNTDNKLCYFDKKTYIFDTVEYYEDVYLHDKKEVLVFKDRSHNRYIARKGSVYREELIDNKEILINSSGTRIYYLESNGDLMVYDIEKKKSTRYDQNVVVFDLLVDKDKCVYVKNITWNHGDLYVDKKLVDTGVNVDIALVGADKDGNIIYTKDHNPNLAISRRMIDLYIYIKGKPILVDKGIFTYNYLRNKTFAYSKEGSVFYHNGKEKREMETFVDSMIVPRKEYHEMGDFYQYFFADNMYILFVR